MKENLTKLHAQRLFWKPNSINALWWVFYYVNNNNGIDVIAPHVMRYIFYYNSPIFNLNPKFKQEKD
jgi:hypothetical protein